MSRLLDPLALPLLVPAVFGIFIVGCAAYIPPPPNWRHALTALFGSALFVPYEWVVLTS